VFFRNVQVRWMPIQGDTRATIALERPGASGDAGEFRSGVDAQNVQSRFPLPDVSGEYRYGQDWGYVEAAGIVRYIKWDDTVSDNDDISGDAVGWGVNLSTNLKAGDVGTFRGQVVYGEAIQNYMNDATEDIAAVATNNPNASLDGEALPMLGVVAFYDHNWNSKWSTSVGYSMIDIDLVSSQDTNAFQRGHYALVNLLHYPATNVMCGLEGQFGRRENHKLDGEVNNFEVDDFRVQFSARYNFSVKVGG